MDLKIHEIVLDVVGHIPDLLHPGGEHLGLGPLLVGRHEEGLHHLQLVGDEADVVLDAELQRHLLRGLGLGVAQRAIQHGLPDAHRRRLHLAAG